MLPSVACRRLVYQRPVFSGLRLVNDGNDGSGFCAITLEGSQKHIPNAETSSAKERRYAFVPSPLGAFSMKAELDKGLSRGVCRIGCCPFGFGLWRRKKAFDLTVSHWVILAVYFEPSRPNT